MEHIPNRRRVTSRELACIALHAGVAAVTVETYLSGMRRAHRSSAEKIERSIKELGIVPEDLGPPKIRAKYQYTPEQLRTISRQAGVTLEATKAYLFGYRESKPETAAAVEKALEDLTKHRSQLFKKLLLLRFWKDFDRCYKGTVEFSVKSDYGEMRVHLCLSTIGGKSHQIDLPISKCWDDPSAAPDGGFTVKEVAQYIEGWFNGAVFSQSEDARFRDWLLSRPEQDDIVDDLRQDLSRDLEGQEVIADDWTRMISYLSPHCWEALAEARFEYERDVESPQLPQDIKRGIFLTFRRAAGRLNEDDALPFAESQKKDPLSRGDSGGQSIQGEL